MEMNNLKFTIYLRLDKLERRPHGGPSLSGPGPNMSFQPTGKSLLEGKLDYEHWIPQEIAIK
jgi:hypothetical protein